MINIVYSKDSKIHVVKGKEKYIYDGNCYQYINKLCTMNGTTLEGQLKASQKLLPNYKKLPIYISFLDDYLVPLASPKSKDCIWVSAKNYLMCYEKDNKYYVKFKDKTVHEICFSPFTIKKQYKKYQMLYLKINEMRSFYGF